MKSFYYYITKEMPCDVRMEVARFKVGSSVRDLKRLAKLKDIAAKHGDYFSLRNRESEDFIFNLATQLYGDNSLSITRFLNRNVLDYDFTEFLRHLAHKRAYHADAAGIRDLCRVELKIAIRHEYAKISDL